MFKAYFNNGYEDFTEYFDTLEDARDWIDTMSSESDDWQEHLTNRFQGTWETFDGETLVMYAEID